MASVRLNAVEKYYGPVHAVKGIDLEIGDTEFVVLVGPSGCGKSTLLRMIAGLESLDRGDIMIGGQIVNTMRPRDRDIAMVFQNYALYPYMSVYENVAFGLRARRVPEAEIRARVTRAAELLGIAHLLDRKPRQLSGGQRQRVAMGRAIVRSARLFLFDEPLSNLDAQLRDEMRTEIKRLHREIRTTTIYVTHDQIEAMTLADRIVLMRDGRIEQQGSPLDLFERPRTRFVAGFLGSPQMNFIPAQLEGETVVLEAPEAGGAVRLALPPARRAAARAAPAQEVLLGLRAEHFSRAEAGGAREGLAPLEVTVDLVEPTGTRTFVSFFLGGRRVVAELPSHEVAAAGARLALFADMNRAVLIDPETDRVLT